MAIVSRIQARWRVSGSGSIDVVAEVTHNASQMKTRSHLDGKVVLVTGGGNGIGREIALSCAAEGAHVVVNDVGCDVDGQGSDRDVAARVVSEIVDRGGKAFADARDIRTEAKSIVSSAVDACGRLDGVVACHGIRAERSLLKSDDAFLEQVLDLHFRATFKLVRSAAEIMIERKEGGSIVLASGPAAYFGARGQSALGAASAGVIALTRSAALELRRHRIRVNAIVPTAKTRQTEHLPTFQGVAEDSLRPEHVASLAVYLVSSLAEDVQGEVVGSAGVRTYTFRTRETPGHFRDEMVCSPDEVHRAWRDITRM